MDRPILTGDSLVFGWGDRPLLRSAYLDATSGTVTALVGVSGAGKTTLLEVLVGLRVPASGSIGWRGERLGRASLPALARRGLVYAPDRPWLSGRLPLGRQLAAAAHRSGADWEAVAADHGIGNLVYRYTHECSGGESRLAELAFATCLEPLALVADEPFRGLEPLHREAIGRGLRRLAERGVAVLFADHDPRMVLELADRVFSLEGGQTRAVMGFRERPLREWYREWPGG